MTFDPKAAVLTADALQGTANILSSPPVSCTCTGWYDNPEGQHDYGCDTSRWSRERQKSIDYVIGTLLREAARSLRAACAVLEARDAIITANRSKLDRQAARYKAVLKGLRATILDRCAPCIVTDRLFYASLLATIEDALDPVYSATLTCPRCEAPLVDVLHPERDVDVMCDGRCDL